MFTLTSTHTDISYLCSGSRNDWAELGMQDTLTIEDQQRIHTLNTSELLQTHSLCGRATGLRHVDFTHDTKKSITDSFLTVQLFQSCFLPPYPMHTP